MRDAEEKTKLHGGCAQFLVNFLNGWAISIGAVTARSSTREATGSSASSSTTGLLVHLKKRDQSVYHDKKREACFRAVITFIMMGLATSSSSF